MNPVSTQLELSAAGIRLAGYVMETQLRVAQVFGKAALAAIPFSTPLALRKQAPKGTSVKSSGVVKPKKIARTLPKAVKSAAPTPKKDDKIVAAAPVKSLKAKSVGKAKLEVAKVAKPTPAAKVKPAAPKTKSAAKPASKLSDAKKPAAKSEQVPANNVEFRSQASRETAAGSAKPATAPQGTSAKVAATSSKQNTAAKVQKPLNASAKAARAPSAPPAMPARDKVASKD